MAAGVPQPALRHARHYLVGQGLAINLISQAKTVISALALKRDLGVSCPSAWLLRQKIKRAMADREAAHLLEGAVHLDDAYLGGERSGDIRLPRVVGTLKPKDLPEFRWINTVLGNLKTTLSGGFHALKYREYGQTYLAAFAYRFNRRFDRRCLVATLIADVARSKPVPEKVVRRGHGQAVL